MTDGRHGGATTFGSPGRLARLVAAVVLAGALAGCGDSDPDTVRIAAAASLTDVVDGVAAVLADEDQPVSVEADLAGSATLATQILDGSPVDLFLAADEATMARVVEGGMAEGDVITFASNRLVLAVPAANPGEVTSLDDVGRDDLLVGRCAIEVPCGRLAVDELAESGIPDAADTEEPDVRTLLTKVAAGELDVALVYATDVAATDDVQVVADDRLDQRNRYQAVRVDGGDARAADRFLAVLRGAAGASLLAALGFGPP